MQGVGHGDSHDEAEASRSPTIPVSDLLDILKLISRVEPIDLLLDRTATTITSSFGVKSLVMCANAFQAKNCVLHMRCVSDPASRRKDS